MFDKFKNTVFKQLDKTYVVDLITIPHIEVIDDSFYDIPDIFDINGDELSLLSEKYESFIIQDTYGTHLYHNKMFLFNYEEINSMTRIGDSPKYLGRQKKMIPHDCVKHNVDVLKLTHMDFKTKSHVVVKLRGRRFYCVLIPEEKKINFLNNEYGIRTLLLGTNPDVIISYY